MSVPVSRIYIPPDPLDSGTVLQVQRDEGPRFPGTPFTALVWPDGYVPNSANSEQITVTAVDGDVVTFLRGPNPIQLISGMLIAATDVVPVYELGEDVTLSHDFGSDDPPYSLILHAPSGEIGSYGGSTGVIDDGNGFTAFNFDLNRGGLWHYRWESASDRGPERSLFVQFSDARG